MKHLILTFFFVILCLGQQNAYCQESTDATQATASTITQEEDGPKNPIEADEESQKNKNQDISPDLINENEVGGEEITVLSASDKIADKSRFWSMWQTFLGAGTLLLAAGATIFAGLAWRAAREGVRVADDAAKRQLRAYINMSEWGTRSKSNKFFIDFELKNYGNTVAENVWVDCQWFSIVKQKFNTIESIKDKVISEREPAVLDKLSVEPNGILKFELQVPSRYIEGLNSPGKITLRN